MTPDELYEALTRNPCDPSPTSPRKIDYFADNSNSEVFGTYPQGVSAAYWLARIVDAVSILKYPCFSAAADSTLYSATNNDHEYQLVLPFKFLEQLDGGAYKECCSIPQAAVAHAFRNSADTMRACHYVGDNNFSKSFHRMATEYMTYWGWNSIPDNMLMMGPDLISAEEVGQTLEPQDVLEVRSPTVGVMSCWPGAQGVPGAAHSCVTCAGEDQPKCRSCGCCPPIDPPPENDPCCKPGTPEYYSECCGFDRTATFEGRYIQFAYWVPSQDGSQRGDLLSGRQDEKMYHIGVLERREYSGICNLRNNQADRLNTIDKGLFFEWLQERNGWNYQTMKPKTTDPDSPNLKQEEKIERIRATVPLMLDVSVNGKAGMPSSSSDYEAYLRTIKQLLWNGEGVALFTNVGFPNRRDSQGLAYPDRIWYTMYSIIGYDDRRLEFDECVYVLQCPLGNWITGGEPNWGPLPDGSFLVTETVLKDMIRYMNGSDYYACRQTVCPANEGIDCTDPFVILEYEGCQGVPIYPNCLPYFCAERQSAFGMLFALSLNPRFTQSNKGDDLLHYSQNIPTHVTADLLSESKAYCKIPSHERDDECEAEDFEGDCYLPLDLEFIWGWGKAFNNEGELDRLEGNMYKDRAFKKRAHKHATAHQDIETSAIPINCLDSENNATINIQWEPYLGYLKVNVAKPPGYHIIHLEGKGCF
jgi:hypothetical protein